MSYLSFKIKIISLIFFIFLSSILFFNADSKVPEKKKYTLGVKYYSEKNYKKALKFFNQCHDKSDLLVYLKSKSHFYLKDYNKVITYDKYILKNKFLKEMKIIYTALAHYYLKDFKGSVKILQKISPEDMYIKFFKNKVLADSCFQLKQYKKAVQHYSIIIKKTSFISFYKIKDQYFNKNFEEELFINLFNSYHKLNDLSNIIMIFNKYFKFVKSNELKQNILIKIHKEVQTNSFTLDNKVKFYLARELYYCGKKDISEKYFQSLILIPEKNIIKLKSYFFLALIYQKEPLLFKKYLDGMVKIFNSSDSSLYYYAKAFYIIGKKDEAIKYLKNILIKVKDKNIIKNSLFDLIDYYKKGKEYESYVEKLYSNFKNDLNISRLYFNIGLKKINKGNISQAKDIFTKLINNKYFHIHSSYFLGKICYDKKDYYKAYSFFLDIIQNGNLNYYFIKTLSYFNSLDNKKIKKILLKEIQQYKKDNLKYNFLLFVITDKKKYKTKVRKLINSKNNIKNLVFGVDKLKIKKDENFINYLTFKKNGLHSEAYLLYKNLRKKYKRSLDFYFSMLKYSVEHNFLGNSLVFRKSILYKLNFFPYLICFNKKYLKYYYPFHYKETIVKIIKKRGYKIEKPLLFSLVRQESNFDKLAHSPANAMGLFQVIPSTARYLKKRMKYKTNDTFYNVKVNTSLGIYYFNSLMRKYKKNTIFALSAYNAGERRVYKWKKKIDFKKENPEVFIELIPFKETRNYIKRILSSCYFYSKL